MIFPSCKQTIRLVSEQLDRPLTRREQIGMRLHLLMCSACRAYRRQVLALMRLLRHSSAPPFTAPLSPESKSRIKATIRAKLP